MDVKTLIMMNVWACSSKLFQKMEADQYILLGGMERGGGVKAGYRLSRVDKSNKG